jgi:hypothetical protein
MVSLVKDVGRHRSERFVEANPVVFVTVDGCVLRQESHGDGVAVKTHIGRCLTEW